MAYTTPYAPRERYQGRFDGTIADVIGRQGQMQAELLSRQGDMAAQRWGTIGQVIGQTAGAYLQDRRDEPYRQAQIESLRSLAADRDANAAQRSGAVRAAEQQSKQDEAFGSALQGWDGNPETLAKTAMTIYGPSGLDRAKTIWEGLQAFQVDPSQIKERFELVRAQARAIQALPDAARQGAYATMREQNISLGLLRPEDAPEAYTPDVVAQWANFDAQPKAPKAPFAVGGAVAITDDNGGVTFQTPPQAPPEPQRPVVLSEGAILVDPATGKQIAAGRPKPVAASGGGGSQSSDLVKAVLDNPTLWDNLTPSKKGEIAPELAKAGFKGFGKGMTDATIGKLSESRSAVASLRDLRTTLQENEQFIGPVAGLEALNPYSEARKAQAKIDLVRQRVGKALEGGVLRKEDEEKYKKILATLRDEPSTAIFKVDNLIATIERDMEIFIDEQRGAGRRVGSPSAAPAASPARTYYDANGNPVRR